MLIKWLFLIYKKFTQTTIKVTEKNHAKIERVITMLKNDPEKQFIESLPIEFGDKIDLFGQMIVSLGNILTVLGVSLEASEVEEIEEDVEVMPNEPLSSDPINESNLGFILALIGASTITVGDLVSMGGTYIDIRQSELNEKIDEEYKEDTNKQLKQLENQIALMRNDVNKLYSQLHSLRNDVIYIQNFLYTRYT